MNAYVDVEHISKDTDNLSWGLWVGNVWIRYFFYIGGTNLLSSIKNCFIFKQLSSSQAQ